MGTYSLHGLTIESPFALGATRSAAAGGGGGADVRIAAGPLPEGLPTLGGVHGDTKGGLVLNIGGTARYWIRDERSILVEPEDGVADADVRLYLLGSAMGALLLRRGLFPLHANAVRVSGGAVALAGPSGSGKSTLAHAFAAEGGEVLADDVCAIDAAGRVASGPRRVRLWEDALLAAGLDPEAHPRSFVGDPDYRKHDVALGGGEPASAPLEMVVLLENGGEGGPQRLSPAEAASALVANLYRGEYCAPLGLEAAVLRRAAGLAASVPMFRMARSQGLDRVDEDVERVRALYEARDRAK